MQSSFSCYLHRDNSVSDCIAHTFYHVHLLFWTMGSLGQEEAFIELWGQVLKSEDEPENQNCSYPTTAYKNAT